MTLGVLVRRVDHTGMVDAKDPLATAEVGCDYTVKGVTGGFGTLCLGLDTETPARMLTEFGEQTVAGKTIRTDSNNIVDHASLGFITMFGLADKHIPAKYVKCDGRSYRIKRFPEFAALTTSKDSERFTVPDIASATGYFYIIKIVP